MLNKVAIILEYTYILVPLICSLIIVCVWKIPLKPPKVMAAFPIINLIFDGIFNEPSVFVPVVTSHKLVNIIFMY